MTQKTPHCHADGMRGTGDCYDRRDGYTASRQTMQQKKEKKDND